jgi:signal transduction histidine kinase
LKEIFRPQDELVVSALAEELGFSKERPLVMGMNTNYPPLQYVSDRGYPKGYDVQFTTILMKRMGIPFTFSPNHWDKMSPGVIEGKYDVGMLVYSSYRKDITNYSNAVFRLYYQIVYRNQDYKEFDFRHLKGKRIAYMKSRPVGLMLKDAEAEDHSVTDLGEAFVDLSKGEYDGVICYRFQAKYFIDKLGLEEVLATDELSLEPREYCYASYNKKLIEAIDKELKRMEEEGVIDEVYGQEVVSQFGAIEIPVWIWVLLVCLTFLFLLVFSVNRYLYSKRLQLAYNQMAEKNDALLLANAKAEESTRMKSGFIKQISHEIRTPLNILSGFTQVLTSSDAQLSDAERFEASRQIMESTNRITGLVNKMLELSDVNSHVVLERNDSVTALQIAQQAMLDSGIADSSHIDFQLKEDAGSDTTITTDFQAAVRIVALILDNAIKFSRPAEAFLPQMNQDDKQRATLTISKKEDKACFIIENTGKIIPVEEAEHIFDEFVQLDEYYDGTGIGLSVARSLARRLGGDVVLDTTYTEGARFVVTLAL